VVYTTTGSSNSVTANTATLNADLAAAGLGAYTFSSLGGSSDYTSSFTTSQHILVTGGLTVTSGGTGEGTPFTIVVSEDGFTQPPIGQTLNDAAAASFGGATGSAANSGTYSGPPSLTVTPATLTETSSPPTSTASASIPTYVTPYTLTSQTVISLTASSSSAPGTLGITNQVTVTGVPEPAGLVMMLTGMPLPLVVLGLLRRRAAA